ncbi:hypothetical protein DFP72DRAFT_1168521 [Ephemerocybe angulata]|uniref:Uncharacterized protein n=1 Tax=Ephemerocybe angulata TaxID=980116 RepID=A0A8H6I4L9_9AGAR|nr:hypothetical protein DFP72DRAFT_1168521 [Tulosesus angulatus]
MKFFAVAVALISVVPAISALTINTPTGVVPCQPILLTYGSGVPPYYLSILPGGQVSSAPLHIWDPTNAESMTWVVDLPSGTSISLAVKDSTGAQAYSDAVTILGNGDTSCLNQASSSNAAAGTRPANSKSSSATHGASSASASSATRAASAGTATAHPAGTSGTTVAGTVGAHPSATQSASSNAAAGGSGGTTTSSSSGANRVTTGAYGVGAAFGLIGALLL